MGYHGQINCQSDTVVTTTADSGPGSLRQAILDANTNPGKDTITFNIPGSGPHIIAPLTSLPAITDPVIIDGTTQPGASCTSWPPTLMIELDATQGALNLRTTASTVRALVINRSRSAGIQIFNGGGNLIQCNFIGTDTTGTIALSNNREGIYILNSPDNIIGTNGDSYNDGVEGNLISGNGEVGVAIEGSAALRNRIAGNRIGTDISGTQAVPNGYAGVFIRDNRQNVIGTNSDGISDIAERNLISGNTFIGVEIGYNAEENTIAGNYIGPDINVLGGVGEQQWGVMIDDQGISPAGFTRNNHVGGTAPKSGNLIAYNLMDGVIIMGGNGVTQNPIRGNRIFANHGLGIELRETSDIGVTANDPGDVDTGPNEFQNYPELTEVSTTHIAGKLNSLANTTFVLEFFDNTECNSQGYGEGEFLLAMTSVTTVTTNNSGDMTFLFDFAEPLLEGGSGEVLTDKA